MDTALTPAHAESLDPALTAIYIETKKIKGADKTKKCKEDCDSNKMGKECRMVSTEIPIARAEIVDIDHPGNIYVAIGPPIIIASAYTTLLGAYGGWDGTIPVAAVGVASLVASIWGLYTWMKSRSAAEAPTVPIRPGLSRANEPECPKLTPVALTDGERTYWGLGMSWSW